METDDIPSLTKVPKGPTLSGMVRAPREDRLSERMPIMKTLLRARQVAPKKNDSILPSHSRRHGASETGAWQEQHGDGRALRHIDRPAVAQVHGGGCEQQSRYGDAHAVLRDGSARAGCGDVRPDIESDARGRCNDRAGQTVTNAGHVSALTSPTLIIRKALRAAALAPTYQDALDVTGDALRRLAELARAEVSHG